MSRQLIGEHLERTLVCTTNFPPKLGGKFKNPNFISLDPEVFLWTFKN